MSKIMATRKRATQKEKNYRIAVVQEWILDADEDLDFQETIKEIMDRWELGRRQAIRYWVEARERLMDAQKRARRRYYSPRARRVRGRFARW